jgi:hypothetical protein
MNDEFRKMLIIKYLAVIFKQKKSEKFKREFFGFFFENGQNTEGPLLMLHHKLMHRLPLFPLHRKEI